MGRMQRRDVIAAAAGMAVTPALGHAAGDAVSLAELDATAATQAMRQGDVKAEAYARALLDKAAEQEDLNVFVTLDRDAVLEAARAADQAREAGKALGLLHGLPIPVKDGVSTAALPTSNGTRSLRGFRPKDDAALVKRLLGQGAVVMGKTNMTELSFGWTSNNGAFGPVRNPYDRGRIPGGSSGGSAAAVAARIAPLAVAADTLGSIRVPAALCGVAGLRPSYGRYPGNGVFALTEDKLDQVGPVARSVADLALFDRAVTGEAAAPGATPLKGVRIGTSPFYLASLDPEVGRATGEAFRKLRDAGAVLVEADVPEAMKSAFDVAAAIMLYETMPSIERFLREQGTGLTFDQVLAQVSEGMQGFIKAVALPPNRPPQETYEAMLAQRARVKDAVRLHFEQHGIVALAFPAVAALPPRIGEEAEVEIDGKKVSFFTAFGRNTALSPAAGMAGLVLPIGLSSGGLPVALEFDALAGRDGDLLSLGLSLQKALGTIPPPKA